MKKFVFYIGLVVLLCANAALLRLNYPYMMEYGKVVWDKIFPSDVKIFVTYHKPYRLPVKGRILQPIQVGRAIEKEPFMGGRLSEKDIEWLHQHTIGDDTGDNISDKNRTFDVLTAYYWVWKHYKEIGHPKYIGFLAHRKILSFQENSYRKFNIYSPDYGYDEKILEEILKQHRVIAYKWIPWHGPVTVSVYDHYQFDHHIEDLNVMTDIIRRDYPEMIEAMEEVLYQEEVPYAIWNFWVMEKELAFDYFEKLFHIMFGVEEIRGAEIMQYDLKQRRALGYLAERFYAIWLEYQIKSKGIKPFYVNLLYL